MQSHFVCEGWLEKLIFSHVDLASDLIILYEQDIKLKDRPYHKP